MQDDTQTINQLMAVAATDAIQFINNYDEQSITLSAADLIIIDETLHKLAIEHTHNAFSDEKIFTICSIFGAFVGEVFKNAVGGEWFMDKSIPDAPFVVLNFGGKSYPFASVCYEKLANNPSISLTSYYQLAIEKITQ